LQWFGWEARFYGVLSTKTPIPAQTRGILFKIHKTIVSLCGCTQRGLKALMHTCESIQLPLYTFLPWVLTPRNMAAIRVQADAVRGPKINWAWYQSSQYTYASYFRVDSSLHLRIPTPTRLHALSSQITLTGTLRDAV